ncbi:mucin-1-like [Amphibalanus amphitrite]|uniref:mucin-1-like n=1 Tax=Amphibalanus amphitrite TaxID=1232801 RepID=UPI001C91A42B|nr:mucin-1-like [Amphibalanus amphitrite]XP_043211185.1 mucin-1-like [Amphibalanus amphitrite]
MPPATPKGASCRVAPVALVLVLVLVTPLVPVVQSEPAYRQSAFLPPLGRSAQGRYQGPSQVQHIVHVPDQRSNGFNGFSSGGDSDGSVVISPLGAGSTSSYSDRPGLSRGPVITISGFGGTITISPGPVTSTGTSTGTTSIHSDTNSSPAYVSDSGSDFGSQLSTGGGIVTSSTYDGTTGGGTFISSSLGDSSPNPPQNEFVFGPELTTYSGFDSGTQSTSGFIDGTNSNSQFLTSTDVNSGFIGTPTPNFNTGFHQNSDIGFSHSTISEPRKITNFVSGPDSSFTTTISKTPAFTSLSHSFDTIPATSFDSQRGSTGGTSFLPHTSITTTGTSRSVGVSSPQDTSSKVPKSTVFGPNFGKLPGHSRRKLCKKIVDLEAEFDLRLIPYNIPVIGPEVPSTGCPRDQIRFGSLDGPCIRALERGSCSENQWILFDNVTNVGTCQERLCPVGTAFVEADGLCHDQFEVDFCPGDRLIQVTASGESVCGCDDGWYPDRCGVCQLIFSHDGCPSGLAHQFNTRFEFRCLPTPCPRTRPVQLPGGKGCSFFGGFCERTENNVTVPGVWGFLTDSLTVACISDEATVSRRRRDVTEVFEPDTTPGHSGARFRRAVFGGGAPVNSCQPGARSDFNAACRSAAVPARSRRATSTNAPTCPRGGSMVNGKCSGGGDDLGK